MSYVEHTHVYMHKRKTKTHAPFMPPIGHNDAHHSRFSKVREKTTAPAVMRRRSQADKSAFWGRFHSCFGFVLCFVVGVRV
jgi:hypothetical protein